MFQKMDFKLFITESSQTWCYQMQVKFIPVRFGTAHTKKEGFFPFELG